MEHKVTRISLENLEWLKKIDKTPNRAITFLRTGKPLENDQAEQLKWELTELINKLEKKFDALDAQVNNKGSYNYG